MSTAQALKEEPNISFVREKKAVTAIFTSDTDLYNYGATEISFIEKGSGILRIFGKSVPCAEGEIYIIEQNIPHEFFISEQKDALTICTLRFKVGDWFSGDISREESERYCYGVFHEGTVAYANLTKQTENEIRRLFDEIFKEYDEKRSEWYEAIKADLSLIFITVRRYIDNTIKNIPTIPKKEREIVFSVIRMIEERLGEKDLTLNALASSLFISPSYLSRIFKEYMGQSFSDFIRNFRMDRACRLLAETDETVSDIVSHCGLKDIPFFYKSFSRYKGTTPNQYRSSIKKIKYKIKSIGENNMSILNEISENLQIGKAKIVKELVQKALDEGMDAKTILEDGLISGMNIVGEKFKNNEIYIPEVLVAARALNMGTQILKPYFGEAGVEPIGRICIGTVEGDLHDIGKNLVKMMMEGKQIEVIDLGTDVSADTFVNTAIEQNCQIICCSALLTTTMSVMKDVVDKLKAAGMDDKIKVMIGGAPVNEDYCKKIGADVYTVDAASAADAAVEICKALKA